MHSASRFLLVLGIAGAACGGESGSGPATADAGGDDGGDVRGDAAAGADAGTGADGEASAPVVLPTGRFRIGMWCGPPAAEMTKERIAEIAGAGFTTVSNACEGTTAAYDQQMLALATDAGLDAIVGDQRLSAALAGTDVAANLDAVVKDYGGSPALAGYFLADEPATGAFANLAAVAGALAQRDPAHFAYVNLLPNYATAAQLGTQSYDSYVAGFLSTVKPKVVSFDYYPFYTNGADATTFFDNLAVVRAHAVATSTPFWQFTQSISFNGHRATTLAEKLWMGTQTIAYGGAGISYFTYWTPPQTAEGFGSGIIDLTGQRTAEYDEVKAINLRLAAFGKYTVMAKSTAVFHNGPLDSGTTPRVPGAAAYLPSAAPVTVGLFDVTGGAYAFLANRDYTKAVEVDVYLASSAPERLDVVSGSFAPMQLLGRDANGTKVHLTIAPGDGELVHLPGPDLAGAPGAEAYLGSVRADAGFLDVIDASFGTARLRSASWNDCPEGYLLAGRNFVSNGFWLCARKDLAGHTFYVGDVIADAGTMFAVSGGTATAQGAASWDTCPKGKLLGHRVESNGYWVCVD